MGQAQRPREDAESIDDFLASARAFLDAHAERKPEERFEWGVRSDRVAIFPEKSPEEDRAQLEEARAWRRTVFDAGFGWITGPTELGGRGLTSAHQRAYDNVERQYATPSTAVFGITYGMVAPTTVHYGTDEAKRRYAAGCYRGDVLGCQLFSEPGAGSDVASLSTRAERDGDEWVVNGQKVWTSGAHLADIGLLLARTDPDAPKHKGLTMFLVDMRQPGVEVRPLRQMTGGSSFNEVFFTDARIPDWMRLGEVNAGWGVAITTLMHERASASSSSRSRPMTMLLELAKQRGADRDPVLRQQVVDVYIHNRVATLTTLRSMARVKAGQAPGPEMSIGKLAGTQNLQRIADVVGRVLGPRLTADTGEWGTYAWSEFVLSVPGIRLGGGTDEIQRNIVAERVLGLPKEPTGA